LLVATPPAAILPLPIEESAILADVIPPLATANVLICPLANDPETTALLPILPDVIAPLLIAN